MTVFVIGINAGPPPAGKKMITVAATPPGAILAKKFRMILMSPRRFKLLPLLSLSVTHKNATKLIR